MCLQKIEAGVLRGALFGQSRVKNWQELKQSLDNVLQKTDQAVGQ